MSCRILLVGESNPYGPDPEFALYCHPPGCAGHWLRRILGLSEDQYLALHRTNLCEGAWSREAARRRARELLDPQAVWRVVVLLGRKVTETFESVALDGPLLPFATTACCSGMTLVSFPHPSGRNLSLWGQSSRHRAREILRSLAPEVSWGSEAA